MDPPASASTSPPPHRQQHRTYYLIALLYSFVCMGMCVALTGPTLLELGRQSHATLNELPFIYSCRSVGVFAGTYLGGLAVDRWRHKSSFILSIAVLGMSLSTIIIVHIPIVYLLGVVNFIQGMLIGTVDNIAQIVLIKLYTTDVASYMQALHCAFAVGAFISPLVASPFLDPNESKSLDIQSDSHYTYAYYIIALSILPSCALLMWLSIVDEFKRGKSGTQSSSNQEFIELSHIDTQQDNASTIDEFDDIELNSMNKYDRIQHNTATNGAQIHPNGNSHTNTRSHTESNHESTNSNDSSESIEGTHRLKIVLLIGFFLFLYVGCESGYGSYSATYAVKQVNFDEQKASLLSSSFWFTFTLGRIIAIPVSLFLKPSIMVFIDLFGCIISLLMILIFPSNALILWIGSGFYGFSVASIYPSAIIYTENSVNLSGKHLSYLTMFATCGEALIPLAIGETIPLDPIYMMIIQVLCAISASLLFAYIMRIQHPTQPQYLSTISNTSINHNATEMSKLHPKHIPHSDEMDMDGLVA